MSLQVCVTGKFNGLFRMINLSICCKEMKYLDPRVFFPSIWAFLYGVAHVYPDMPNAVTKRKYYDFIQNLPLFIPEASCANYFSRLLDTFPVSPYLDNKDSFTYWVHCIHNRMDQYLGLPEKTMLEHLDEFYGEFLPKQYILSEKRGIQKKYLVFGFILISMFCIVLYYTPSNTMKDSIPS